MSRELIREELLKFGTTLPKGGTFTRNPQADALLRSNPFAFLMAASTDRGARAETVWELPWHLDRKLGGLDQEKLSRMTDIELEAMLRQLDRKPRFPNKVAKTIVSLAKLVTNTFGGDARRVWSGRPIWEVLRSLQQVYGVGPGIAHMTVRILIDEGQYSSAVDELRQLDIKADALVTRVFYRSGLSPTPDSNSCIGAARQLHPECPGKLDWPAWEIGREYCRESNPKCPECPLGNICPKEAVRT